VTGMPPTRFSLRFEAHAGSGRRCPCVSRCFWSLLAGQATIYTTLFQFSVHQNLMESPIRSGGAAGADSPPASPLMHPAQSPGARISLCAPPLSSLSPYCCVCAAPRQRRAVVCMRVCFMAEMLHCSRPLRRSNILLYSQLLSRTCIKLIWTPLHFTRLVC
jgi:hypothetical protein